MPSLGIAPAPKDCRRRPRILQQGPAPVSGVFPVGVIMRRLEIGIQAIQLSPYHAGPPDASPHTPGHDHRVGWHAIVPCPLSRSGKPSDPKTSPPIPPRCAGDTAERLVAQLARRTVMDAALMARRDRIGDERSAAGALRRIDVSGLPKIQRAVKGSQTASAV